MPSNAMPPSEGRNPMKGLQDMQAQQSQPETITITVNGDGTFTVAESENDASEQDQPINETVKSVEEVLQLVQQALGDEGETDEQAWNRMAQEREQQQGEPE